MASASGPASCTTPLARSTSCDLADERAVRHALRPILGGTLDEVTVFDAAFTQFFFPARRCFAQDQMPSTRREPGTDADGRERTPRTRAMLRHRTPTRTTRPSRAAVR